MRDRMEVLINEMLDGRIMLDEAITEFEKLYILAALSRYSDHLSKTASALGIHRNTLSKRVAVYAQAGKKKPAKLGRKKTPAAAGAPPHRTQTLIG